MNKEKYHMHLNSLKYLLTKCVGNTAPLEATWPIPYLTENLGTEAWNIHFASLKHC